MMSLSESSEKVLASSKTGGNDAVLIFVNLSGLTTARYGHPSTRCPLAPQRKQRFFSLLALSLALVTHLALGASLSPPQCLVSSLDSGRRLTGSQYLVWCKQGS
jgi:hypothetical protein